jgi:hypothetical protein
MRQSMNIRVNKGYCARRIPSDRKTAISGLIRPGRSVAGVVPNLVSPQFARERIGLTAAKTRPDRASIKGSRGAVALISPEIAVFRTEGWVHPLYGTSKERGLLAAITPRIP